MFTHITQPHMIICKLASMYNMHPPTLKVKFKYKLYTKHMAIYGNIMHMNWAKLYANSNTDNYADIYPMRRVQITPTKKLENNHTSRLLPWNKMLTISVLLSSVWIYIPLLCIYGKCIHSHCAGVSYKETTFISFFFQYLLTLYTWHIWIVPAEIMCHSESL